MRQASSIALERHPDSQLWLTAFALAVFTALLLVGLLSIVIRQVDWSLKVEQLIKPAESAEATLYFEPMETNPADPAAVQSKPKPFARTSDDQPVSTERTNERIGERSTQATSDRAADPNAEALPSQFGIEPKDGEIETTESRYQDGKLLPAAPTDPFPAGSPSSPSPASAQQLDRRAVAEADPQTKPVENSSPADAPPVETTDTSEPTLSEERSLPPARETLLVGPESVEVKVPLDEGESERPRETPERPTQQTLANTQDPTRDQTQASPASATSEPKEKQFQGFQRKTAVVGSISRTGRSALNVDDTEMGRYQAAISKAVELEWQRNCVRHRDFITPGFLTVRFCVEPSGRVRTVNFIGEMETGEVQKGFTLSSIREAEIPQMPESLAKAYEGDALELVFRFYF